MTSRTMRIAYVAPRWFPSPGGVETHIQQLAKGAAAAGFEVDILAMRRGAQPAVERCDSTTVRRFEAVTPVEQFELPLGLMRFLRKNRAGYHLIHAHGYHALPSLVATCFADGPPIVFTPHYHGVGHSPVRRLLHRAYRPLARRLFDRVQRVICVSLAEAHHLVSDFPNAAALVEHIPNGVDVSTLANADPIPTSKCIVLVVARLEPYKRVDRVIATLRSLDSRFELAIVGTGPSLERLKTAAAASQVEARVRWLGRLEQGDLHRWYRTAAVCVSLSPHEAFGLTIAEAHAAGAGVVASDIPAHREITSRWDRTQVRLVPLDVTPTELAVDIQAMAATRHVHRCEHVPTWDSVVERTLRLYSELTDAPLSCRP